MENEALQFHEIAMIFPQMDGQEYQMLVSDIQQYGLLEPIWLYDGKILDGRNRYRACREAGIKPAYREFIGDDPLAFVISENLHRRHLNPFQRAEIVLKLKPELREKAKERQIAGGKYKLSQKSVKALDVQKQLARLARVSHDTIAKAEKIIQNAEPKQIQRLRTGQGSINAVYREVKRVEKRRELEKIPTHKLEGKFNVVLADPPWQYDVHSSAFRGTANDHYPTMKLEDILNLPVKDHVLANAVLFLWTTSSMLRKAFPIMDAWGFEFKTSMVWVKPHIGTGFYVRGKHELVLIGIRGQFLPMTTDLPSSVFNAPRKKHSEKPDVIYTIIEHMYPEQRYLELFQRGSLRKGWVGWGLESEL